EWYSNNEKQIDSKCKRINNASLFLAIGISASILGTIIYLFLQAEP
ncbi:unnamed protein product, partial [marine sediment metagenome]